MAAEADSTSKTKTRGIKSRVQRYVRDANAMDVRSLAAMRICISLTVIYDVIHNFLPYGEQLLSDGQHSW